MLAVVSALHGWRHYLLGKPFLLYTDNSAVSWFLKQPTLMPKQARWLQTLSEYNLQIIHKPGVQNVVADALSRRPDHRVSSRIVNTWQATSELSSMSVVPGAQLFCAITSNRALAQHAVLNALKAGSKDKNSANLTDSASLVLTRCAR